MLFYSQENSTGWRKGKFDVTEESSSSLDNELQGDAPEESASSPKTTKRGKMKGDVSEESSTSSKTTGRGKVKGEVNGESCFFPCFPICFFIVY